MLWRYFSLTSLRLPWQIQSFATLASYSRICLGASLQNHLHIAAVIIGWGIKQIWILVNTVAVCKSAIFRFCFSTQWNNKTTRCLLPLKKNWFEGVRLSNFYIPGFGVGVFQVSWADKHEACRQWDGSCVRLTFITLSSATYSYCLRDCCWLIPFGGSIASMERPKTTKDYFLPTYLIIRSWSKLISLSFEMKD